VAILASEVNQVSLYILRRKILNRTTLQGKTVADHLDSSLSRGVMVRAMALSAEAVTESEGGHRETSVQGDRNSKAVVRETLMKDAVALQVAVTEIWEDVRIAVSMGIHEFMVETEIGSPIKVNEIPQPLAPVILRGLVEMRWGQKLASSAQKTVHQPWSPKKMETAHAQVSSETSRQPAG
jgi:hypothetical protein